MPPTRPSRKNKAALPDADGDGIPDGADDP